MSKKNIYAVLAILIILLIIFLLPKRNYQVEGIQIERNYNDEVVVPAPTKKPTINIPVASELPLPKGIKSDGGEEAPPPGN